MPDPITAGVGWGISTAGWLVSPIISRIVNEGIDLLDLNAPERLKTLEIQVLRLQRLLEVADESTYRVRLEPLINDLKSALYEAEDILDSVEYETLEKKIQDAKSDGTKMDLLEKLQSAMPSNPLQDKDSGLPKLELEESLNKIESAISDACTVLQHLNLPSVSNPNGIRAAATNSPSAITTASPPLRVIGREQERDKIIAMLHENEVQCQATTVTGTVYSVIGIHGIAGSGKSTLAQCVYDHEKRYKQAKIEGHFDILMWIHVSQNFALDSIFSEMFEGATGEVCPKFRSLNVLKEQLEEELHGKRILLVLDDVWYNSRNAGDLEELQKLISPLHVAKAGSRILATSRTDTALVALGAVKERCIPISDLNDELYFEMFMHYALRDASISVGDRRKLECIGEDIAKKLKRSPLAARTVGSRLSVRQNVDFWHREKDRGLMNDTMGALWWSYQYLDEKIRRCFTYCSIFPRRHKLKRDELVKLWVAEGFIKTSTPEEEMEDVAQNYFDELLSASFLQLGGKEKLYEHESEVDYFTIHDLLCDLAEEVAGRDCFRIEKGYTREVPSGVRYLFVGNFSGGMLTKISELKQLRTLIVDDIIMIKSTEWGDIKSMLTVFAGLLKLRVLKLHVSAHGNSMFSFPDSIGQLKHLRYFTFLVGEITKLTLPDAFTKLYHMQVVDFGECKCLVFSGDEDMMNLVKLRRVISKADLDFPNIGRMTCLEKLPFFTIRKKEGYKSGELKHLNKLQGKLQIHGLHNVNSKVEALEVNLAGKEKLTELVLQWDSGSCNPNVEAEVLEGLCPSKYLERLEIKQYHGMTLPNWMMGQHTVGPKNLQELRLSGWSQVGSAPDLGPFIHLHLLYLYKCNWDSLPNMEHLILLNKLEIDSCMNMGSLAALPKSLEEFTVVNCNHRFMLSCIRTVDQNCQKIEHIPKKTIEITEGPFERRVPFTEDGN